MPKDCYKLPLLHIKIHLIQSRQDILDISFFIPPDILMYEFSCFNKIHIFTSSQLKR